jgi:NifU-like protein involved in Fe-S cluster formation
MTLDYSKQVMKNFTHPKNMGEIKNADGIGKVGNPTCGDIMHVYIKVEKKGKKEHLKDIKFKTFGCLPPYEKINLKNDWIDISKLSKEDFVLNGAGENVKVKNFYKGDFNGELYHITPFISKYNGFYVTPTHPILCIKRKFLKSAKKSSSKCDWLRVPENELLLSKPYYIEAELIEKGDYLIFPKLKKSKDNDIFNTNIMKLLGYYLSEGYITSKGNTLNFSFNKNEKEYIEEVQKLIKEITGKTGNFRIRKNVCEVYVCSAKWCRFFEKYCGRLAKSKKLSEEVMQLPFKKQWLMIETFIKGDGNIYQRRLKDTPTYRMDTASEDLAIQFQRILARGDIFAPIKKSERAETIIEGRKLKPHIIFNLSFKLDKNHKFAKEKEDYFLVPIKKIEKTSFKGEVYNIEVCGEDNSYLVKGFVVHNCAAAIATSSMVTQLAKGKTIEEAEKIKYEDVMKQLGGLPKVKVHCSMMAQEALNKAIKNYKEKKIGK